MFKIFIYLLFVGSGVSNEEFDSDSCGHNSQALQLAKLIISQPRQERPLLECNQLLVDIAQKRAGLLARNQVDLKVTPNQFLISEGYKVPSYYPVSGNQVEAVVKNITMPEQAMQYLIDSGEHSEHILGKGEFFGLQSQLGVGFFKSNDVTQHDQWVVLIAQPWQRQKIVFKKQKPNMPFKTAEGCDKDWKNGNDEFLKSKCRGMGKARSKKTTKSKQN